MATRVAMDSPTASLQLLSRLRRKASGLETFTDRGRIVPELAGIGIRRYRELVVAPHRLLYRHEDRRVLVVAVLDGRRDLEETLMRRLLGT